MLSVTGVEENNKEQWEDVDDLGMCSEKYITIPGTGSVLIFLSCRQKKVRGETDVTPATTYVASLPFLTKLHLSFFPTQKVINIRMSDEVNDQFMRAAR